MRGYFEREQRLEELEKQVQNLKSERDDLQLDVRVLRERAWKLRTTVRQTKWALYVASALVAFLLEPSMYVESRAVLATGLLIFGLILEVD